VSEVTNHLDRFNKAKQLGAMALLRLRAEVLIGNADADTGNFSLTTDERDKLERIAVAPNSDDREFLNSFDDRLMADEDEI
jgi:hypothetical protein